MNKQVGHISRLPVDPSTQQRKGYGFISSEGQDFFFHTSGLQRTTRRFNELNEGDRVEFTPVQGEKGLRAIEVRVV